MTALVPPSAPWRDDPGWQDAQQRYLAHDPTLTPIEQLARRLVAIADMYAIEASYE